MKKFKKILCIALIALLFVPMLAGCELFKSNKSGMKRATISDMEQTNVVETLTTNEKE